MAASTITGVSLVLNDYWPGLPTQNIPTADGNGNHFTNSTHHNVSTAIYKPGTKVEVWDISGQGFSTLVYLRYNDSDDETGVLGSIAVPEAVVTSLKYYDVTVDGDSISSDVGAKRIPFGIMLSTMTNTYFGWFWCGGVCPIDWTPLLATTTVATQNTVKAGAGFSITDGASDSDEPVLALCDANMYPSGWSMSADV